MLSQVQCSQYNTRTCRLPPGVVAMCTIHVATYKCEEDHAFGPTPYLYHLYLSFFGPLVTCFWMLHITSQLHELNGWHISHTCRELLMNRLHITTQHICLCRPTGTESITSVGTSSCNRSIVTPAIGLKPWYNKVLPPLIATLAYVQPMHNKLCLCPSFGNTTPYHRKELMNAAYY